MSFDQSLLIWHILIPGGIVLVAAVIAWWLERNSKASTGLPVIEAAGQEALGMNLPVAEQDSVQCCGTKCCTREEAKSSLAALTFAMGWWLASSVSVWAASKFVFLAEDFWPRFVLPMGLSALSIAPLNVLRLGQRPLIWIIYCSLVTLAALMIMPSGESWADIQSLHRTWMAALATAGPLGAFLLIQISERGGARWLPLVILAQLGVAAIVCAASYGALLNAVLGAITATIIAASVAAFGWIKSTSAIVFPSLIFAATMIASGRFYSYDEIPTWGYGIAIFLPCIIGIVDTFLDQRKVALRIIIAALIASSISGITAFTFLG